MNAPGIGRRGRTPCAVSGDTLPAIPRVVVPVLFGPGPARSGRSGLPAADGCGISLQIITTPCECTQLLRFGRRSLGRVAARFHPLVQ